MRTVKWNPFLSGVCALLGGLFLYGAAARADVSATNPAAIVVFPKIVFNSHNGVDTVIQLTNTAPNPVNVRCFYVDANGHCSNDPSRICNPEGSKNETLDSCFDETPPLGTIVSCRPSWNETDFSFRMTAKQPLVWTVGLGLAGEDLPLADSGADGNSGSISAVPEDPMVGELKCVEVGDDDLPIASNDLKGEATIEHVFVDGPPFADIRAYNAIGIQAKTQDDPKDNTLVIGREYNACPNILLMDHFFDDAFEPAAGDTVRSDLTLVPCSEDFNLQAPIKTTVQFLVYNEFEQRFSTSTSVQCFREIHISDIGTRPGPSDDRSSIFNVNIGGTLNGQALIRAVADSDTDHGHGLIGIVEEFHGHGTYGNFVPQFSDAFSLQERGERTQLDVLKLPGTEQAIP